MKNPSSRKPWKYIGVHSEACLVNHYDQLDICSLRTTPYWISLLALWFLLGILVGCTPKNPKDAKDGPSEDRHTQRNWPGDIFRASEQLQSLCRAEANCGVASSESVQVLSDILSYLPLLAADSDLDRHSFEYVDQQSERMLLELNTGKFGRNAGSNVFADLTLKSFLERLASICDAEKNRLDALGGEK